MYISTEQSRIKRKRNTVKSSRRRQLLESESGLGSDMGTTGESDVDANVGCIYCKIEPFADDDEREQHINTTEHKRNLNSDSDRKPPWKWRKPPPNVIDGNYSICDR